MSMTVDWKSEIEAFAPPYKGNRKAWLSQAARRVGISLRTIKSLYYGEVTDPRHSVASEILKAADEARAEAAKLAALYQSIVGGQDASNENLSGEDVAALVHAARALSSLAGTGT